MPVSELESSAEYPAGLAATRRYMPWLVAVALFMENLDATIVNTAVPTMAANLHVAPLSLKAVLTSYTLSLAVFIPVSGWFADRFGTRRVFNVAIWLFLFGSLGCGFAPSVPLLVAARVLQGIGGAMMTPVARLALVRTFPRSEMLRTMNFVVIPALLGPLLGPVTGGLIVHVTSWRVIFFVNIPLALFGLWLTRRYMPDFRDSAVARLDRVGFLLFSSGIALLSYVLEVFGEHHQTTGPVAVLAAAALVLLAGYGWHARRRATPLLELALLKVRTFRVSVLGGFVTRLGVGGMPFLLPLLYQIGLGYPAWQAGLLTVPQALAAMGMKIISRPVLKRFGHRTILLTNTVLLGLTMMTFTQIDRGAPLLAILGLSLAQGFFASLQFTSMNSLVYADVDDRDASKASIKLWVLKLEAMRCKASITDRSANRKGWMRCERKPKRHAIRQAARQRCWAMRVCAHPFPASSPRAWLIRVPWQRRACLCSRSIKPELCNCKLPWMSLRLARFTRG